MKNNKVKERAEAITILRQAIKMAKTEEYNGNAYGALRIYLNIKEQFNDAKDMGVKFAGLTHTKIGGLTELLYRDVAKLNTWIKEVASEEVNEKYTTYSRAGVYHVLSLLMLDGYTAYSYAYVLKIDELIQDMKGGGGIVRDETRIAGLQTMLDEIVELARGAERCKKLTNFYAQKRSLCADDGGQTNNSKTWALSDKAPMCAMPVSHAETIEMNYMLQHVNLSESQIVHVKALWETEEEVPIYNELMGEGGM